MTRKGKQQSEYIMKRVFITLIIALTAVCTVKAQPKTKLRPNETVLLYGSELIENTDPVFADKLTAAGFEMAEDNGLKGPEEIKHNGNIAKISVNARFDLYFPKKANGQMVIVCPGGGYSIVSSYNEGIYVADWMLSQGITVAIVKYRLPNGHWEVPLTDVQNTFRYCRAHAAEWGVKQIGVIGFSAGGHLAASVSTLFVDDITRPDFSILIYPVISTEDGVTHPGTKRQLIGKAEKWNDKNKTVAQWEADMDKYLSLVEKYSIDKQVSKNTPATFIAHCTDDNVVPIENTLRYYRSLVENKIPSEVHIFPKGGHGWGFSKEKFVGEGKDWAKYLRSEYESSLSRWLQDLRQ